MSFQCLGRSDRFPEEVARHLLAGLVVGLLKAKKGGAGKPAPSVDTSLVLD
jgi:hypothetical protein